MLQLQPRTNCPLLLGSKYTGRVCGMSRKALESAALFAGGLHIGVWGAPVKPRHCEQTLKKKHNCDYTVLLLMRASAKAPVTLVT